VVFTALEDGVWVKFYDGTGAQLMQKQMARGERYTVPAEANGPQVWTGRPDALAITVGGRPVPKLAESEGIIRDVPVTAQALLARGQAAPAAAPAAGPTGT
jgi:cytoskeleton protein RodZ